VAERYEPRAYWESTLGEQFDVRGTGYPNLALSINDFLYRQMRRSVEAVVQRAGVGSRLSQSSVLDVGSGSGVWIDFWLRRGAKDVTGWDLTHTSVDNLAKRFRGVGFRQVDIGAHGVPIDRTFAVISAIAVLQHITDDERFAQSLRNLAQLLAADGSLIVMDPVVVHHDWGSSYTTSSIAKARPLAEWDRLLGDVGLERLHVEPVTALLANPVDTRRHLTYRILDAYWQLLSRVVGRHETRGRLSGWPLYGADRVLIAASRVGPSTKTLLVQHAR
jgi:SAM-dependent methyltransferase